MKLKSLKLNGFKSFAKPTTLEFPQRISAIVGPNGSGKSNVTEAAAWVLGEQSMKTLRGKKGEDLIFNGSKTAPRMSRASVSLIFLNEDGEDAAISRVVYRDGTNEYFLNDGKCRLKDIVEFLGNLGLGTSRHHIISQGEADRILTSSSKDRREMIEDALGLRIYQIKKEEGERKLLRTEENIEKAEFLRKEIQPHLKFLKKQVGRAEEAMALSEKLFVLYVSYFSGMETRLLEMESGLEARKKEPKKDFSGLEKKIEELKRGLKKFSEEKNEIAGVRSAVNALEREIGRYEGMISGARMKAGDGSSSAAKKRSIDPEKAEEMKNFVISEIDRVLKETDVSKIKAILFSMKEKVASFFSEAEKSPAVVRPSGGPKELKELEEKYDELLLSLKKLKEKESQLIKENERALELERELHAGEIKLGELKSRLNTFGVEEEKIRLLRADLLDEKTEAKAILKREARGERSPDAGSFDAEKEKRDIERVKIRLEESGSVGEEIMKEYEEVKKRDEFLSHELEDLARAKESLESLIKQVGESLETDFKTGILKINKEFQNFFEIMFGGGKAELKVKSQKLKVKKNETPDEGLLPEVTEVEEEEGIDISVSLPRKRIKGLDMLSGGERALTSIALLFAMSQVNPPPFLILDETDAALDESNSRKYGEMLKDLSKRTQLILVTHNRETMKSAGVLYGVTMGQDGISHLLSVKLAEAEEWAGVV